MDAPDDNQQKRKEPELESRSRTHDADSVEVDRDSAATAATPRMQFTPQQLERAAIYLIEREAIRLRRARVTARTDTSVTFDESLRPYQRPPAPKANDVRSRLRRFLDDAMRTKHSDTQQPKSDKRKDKGKDTKQDRGDSGGATADA